ncbi:MAG: hypothetical protein AB7G13_06080 [Lautropia sp.]
MVLAPLLIAIDPRQLIELLRVRLARGWLPVQFAPTEAGTAGNPAARTAATRPATGSLDGLDDHLQHDLGLRDCRPPVRIPGRGRAADWC